MYCHHDPQDIEIVQYREWRWRAECHGCGHRWYMSVDEVEALEAEKYPWIAPDDFVEGSHP